MVPMPSVPSDCERGINFMNEHHARILMVQGPDRNNSLRGVILRFRRHPYAVTADVENMFHQFAVPDKDKTYLRFFWYENNDPDRPMIEYWAKVHLMGLKSSPAIANT